MPVEMTEVDLTSEPAIDPAETSPKVPVPATLRLAIVLGKVPVGPVDACPVGPVGPATVDGNP